MADTAEPGTADAERLEFAIVLGTQSLVEQHQQLRDDRCTRVRQLGTADSNLVHIARAVRWIRDRYAQPSRVQDVTRLSGMGVSAFHRNFQAVTAMDPIQFRRSRPCPRSRDRHP